MKISLRVFIRYGSRIISIYLILYSCFFFLAMLCGLWDLSSATRFSWDALADSLQVLKMWVRPFWTSKSELFLWQNQEEEYIFIVFMFIITEWGLFCWWFFSSEANGYNFQCWWTFLLMLCWTYLETVWLCLLWNIQG